MTSGTLVIWLLSLVWIMVPVGHVRMGSTGVRAPVWTASGMGHWKRLIIIPGGTDCYYCINNMTCLIHVYYCLVVLVTVPAHVFAIMRHVCIVTLPVLCYTFWGGILLMSMYTLHCLYSVLHCLSAHYAQHSRMVMLHMPSACSLLSRHH